MRFVKAHGAGNDFVLLPDLEDRIHLTAALVQALCVPHTGLGADGVIRLGLPRPGKDADVFMDYRNADGAIVEMCGSGVRCVAKYLVDRGLAPAELVRVDTRAGTKHVRCTLDALDRVSTARVDMGSPVLGKIDYPLEVQGAIVPLTVLSMGNPHAVLLVDDVQAAPVTSLGPRIERHPEFPDGTNVEFMTVPDRGRIVGRIWERGVGETLASGTGASAMAVAAALLGLADRRVRVELPGGHVEATWTEETLFINGPAVEVAAGELDEAWLREVAS